MNDFIQAKLIRLDDSLFLDRMMVTAALLAVFVFSITVAAELGHVHATAGPLGQDGGWRPVSMGLWK
jgi:hypothetical protein